MKLTRIFENESWVVVDKPAGWLTTPARSKDDPRPCLGLRLQDEVGHQIFPVHRLDFEVSGLVLFALNAANHRVASGWFEHGEVVKTYLADTVIGREDPPREWVEWKSQLLRGKKRSYVSPHGKMSITGARVIKVLADCWQWELRPLTGRPHQLRVELANHGTPILGDVLYGGPPHQRSGSESPNDPTGAGIEIKSIALRAVSLDLSKISEPDRAGLPQIISLV